MINNFYVTKNDIVDPETKDFNLHSCEITSEILNSLSNGPIDIITAIENFNDNAPRSKRIQYSVGVEGFNAPIIVAKAIVEVRKDYTIFYAYNNHGSMYVLNNENKTKLVDAISTFVVRNDKISGVNFGSFDKNDCEFLFNNKDDSLSEDALIKLINEEIVYMNTHISCGEYKSAIKHFCMFSVKHDIHNYDYNFNGKAYNRYITLCGAYLNLVKDIVGRSGDKTLNKNDPKVPNKMYFFTNEDDREQFLKTVDHTRMNISDENSFYDDDINTYKEILRSDASDNP